MNASLTPQERNLLRGLRSLPIAFENRFTRAADCELRETLFRALACEREDYLRLFFPNGLPRDRSVPWSLRTAQGVEDGAEYTETARGTACGHIFKSGENTYKCKTCEADDTCILCAKCFESSDHDGHMVFISVSPGNNGCCDCGDDEAWRKAVKCSIHTAGAVGEAPHSSGKAQEKAPAKALGSQLPPDLVEAIRMTIGRAVDYLCDVFSCSPEQLRLPKSEASVLADERLSRLGEVYGEELNKPLPEYALVLWNDEKHTVDDVQNQVARACSRSKKFGFEKAMEVNDVGRSIVHYSRDLPELLKMAEVIERIKVTVTVRTALDTFREQMCASIIDWIADISGCAVGSEPHLLRNVVCEELLKPWRTGSSAANKDVGQSGIDDHETEDNEKLSRRYRAFMQPFQPAVVRVEIDANDDLDDINDDDGDEDEEDLDEMEIEDDMEIEVDDIHQAANAAIAAGAAAYMDVDFMDENEDETEALEATLAGYPPPPPPPGASQQRRVFTPAASDDGEADHTGPSTNAPYDHVPRTPKVKGYVRRPMRPSKHWLEKSEGFRAPRPTVPCEDLWQRVRLDWLILYDLRLWKILRIELRHLYITTVVTIPHFKRILGLRFAGLYTPLAQLYLIADREPDHSIINLSVQMLTTPTITQEVVERGNFLSNLMAILYTFLTTRQVGFPENVSPRATLAFDAGAVTNRRIIHFFSDLRWLFRSEFIQYKMRTEQRYLLQFLDLVKLHQGVCPNVRATGEHVEYESDAWISASGIVKEVNKLCKQVAVSFEPKRESGDGNSNLQRGIRTVGQVTMINSFGYERKRFIAAELKDDMAWHEIGPFEGSSNTYSVPKLVVQTEPMSFHHPLHYLLSWLIEDAKGMSRDELRALLHFSPEDLKDPWNASRSAPAPSNLTADELLSAIFDLPLRTYAWLAQIKAGMWVRNGGSLRHQAHTYRSVKDRDVGYQRDILMIQAGLVLCGTENEMPGERFLAQIIDRFQLTAWFQNDYSLISGFEEGQQLEVIEDLFHLLVVVLSERGNLMPKVDAKEQHERVLQHDIAHALCFKPLSFSDLAGRLEIGESDDFNRVLESMTSYRAPKGMSDTGTFELKPEYIELVDPYYAHYSRNHREEAENIYKKHTARKTGRKAEDVVYEPKLQSLDSGLFEGLADFTATPLFAQVLQAALNYAAGARLYAPKMQLTRIETFLSMVLHLAILATMEDGGSRGSAESGFTKLAASHPSPRHAAADNTIVSLLVALSVKNEYAACHPTIKHILRKMQLRQPEKLTSAIGPLGLMLDRADTGSPASLSLDDKERKKKEALARQARVMAKMKEQQNSFLQNQGLSAFGEDFDDLDDMSIAEEPDSLVEQRKTWSFPAGNCILCQEATDDQRIYGTFAYLGESNILRATPVDDADFVKEVIDTPVSLDRPATDIRPFGVAGANKQVMQKVAADGKVVSFERHGLSKGFPPEKNGTKGPVSTSCGHIMHFSCFEVYLTATQRRQAQQIARNHPERLELKEFICPLCKALGNTFLPIIWKAKECASEHELHAAKSFADWLAGVGSAEYTADLSFIANAPAAMHRQQQVQDIYYIRSSKYVAATFAPSLVSSLQDLSLDGPGSTLTPRDRYSLRRGYSLSTLFRIGRTDTQSSVDSSGLSPQTDHLPRMAELVKAYHRVDETIRANRPGSPAHNDDGTSNAVSPLSRALGLSISAFEIAHRGQGSVTSSTSILAELSEQNLTHLRIFSESIESFLAVNVLRNPSTNTVARETVKKREIMTAQLFGVQSETAMIKLQDYGGNLLFQDDIFLFFADWLALMAPSVAEASDILQLCYWAELVKTIFVYKEVVKKTDHDLLSRGAAPTPASETFKLAVSGMAMTDTMYSRIPLSDAQFQMLRLVVDKYALAFLRKSIVLMHIRYGLEFECPYNIDAEAPELSRLTSILHVPSLEDICGLYTTPGIGSDNLRQITKRWISQANAIKEHPNANANSITVPHPAIFELIGLPKAYDTLTEESTRRKCPTTGKEITDPAICLFCGDIFCSQAVCCMKGKGEGGCYQHMRKCGGKVGIFINIRKCMVLFMHGPGNGSWAYAPYLDKHGEPDPALRRHHQLFLNQKRYDKLYRDAWLSHMIPTAISRILESDINPGGWETL
ncbi:hypothetical protein LTR08_003574 [Meristemomyces frigidus]|nr:hypothetical protein LTR08_003574 [Meristemomyces frigidus]